MIEKAPKTDFKISDVNLTRLALFSLTNASFNKVESEYLYWDKVKYLTKQKSIFAEKEEEVDPKEIWKFIKFKRNLNRKTVYITAKSLKYYSFNYNINDYLQQKLHYLDFNFGAGIQKDQLLNDVDKHRYLTNALMEESIFSSMIEGATTTRIKAKEMLRKSKKPSNKSEQMILNNYKTIQFISDNKYKDISIEKLFEIHRLVTENTLKEESIGKFRTTNDVMVMNQITGEIVHTPPVFEELKGLMEDFCNFFNSNPKDDFIHPIVKASIIHFLIGYIHPFVDGNGRTARALFYWYLLKNGYWLTEYLSISRVILKTKTQYEKAYIYSEIDEMDLSYFIHYKVKVLTQAFEDLKNYIATKKKEESKISKFLKLPNINERQAQILFWLEEDENRFFTVKEIENIFNITNQTARTDIEELVEKNYLKKVSINKKSFNYWKGENFETTFM